MPKYNWAKKTPYTYSVLFTYTSVFLGYSSRGVYVVGNFLFGDAKKAVGCQWISVKTHLWIWVGTFRMWPCYKLSLAAIQLLKHIMSLARDVSIFICIFYTYIVPCSLWPTEPTWLLFALFIFLLFFIVIFWTFLSTDRVSNECTGYMFLLRTCCL